MELNRIDWNTVEIELGGTDTGDSCAGGLRELYEIADKLEQPASGIDPADLTERFRPRLAPSIITRSLAGFFEMSMPRFAIRCRLDDSGSFVNFHRADTLRKLAPGWGSAGDGLEGARSPGGMMWEEAYRTADAVLAVPTALSVLDRFTKFVSTPQLPIIYGEEEQADIQYTSYVKGLPLSGLCAQAACFMAATMMLPWVKRIDGIAEITLIAQSKSDPMLGRLPQTNIKLDGLKADEIERFFDRIGSHSCYQGFSAASIQSQGAQTERENFTTDDRFFSAALIAYLRSGFPVIVPCDLGRFHGTPSSEWAEDPLPSIFAAHNESVGQDSQPESGMNSKRHVVVAVGYARDQQTEIFCHDPSRAPFIRKAVRCLSISMPYGQEERSNRFDRLIQASLFSITPREVTIPLGASIELDNDEAIRRGPCIFTLCYQTNTKISVTHPWLVGHESEPGELILCQLDDLEERLGLLLSECITLEDDPPTREKSGESLAGRFTSKFLDDVRSAAFADQWLWLHVIQVGSGDDTKRLLHLWKAGPVGEKLPEEEEIPIGSWLYDAGDDEWSVVHPHVPQQRTSTGEAQIHDHGVTDFPNLRREGLLRPSLITSYSAQGIGSITDWPVDVGCDLYAFMADDLDFLKLQGTDTSGHSVVERLANWPEDSVSPKAKKLLALLAQASIPESQLVGFATYVPEISSSDPILRERGRSALGKLIELAPHIAPDRCSESRFVIEMVGGALTSRLVPDTPTEAHSNMRFHAEIADSERALDTLVEEIANMATAAERAGAILAVEFEPGPLSVLGHFGQVEQFCNKLDSLGVSSRVVGVNLDIAHFAFVDGITTQQIRDSPIYQRIAHAHIGEHSDRGHFGDLPLLFKLHPREQFEPWIELLNQISSERGPLSEHVSISHPHFSGFVSCELEAARCMSEVNDSIKNIKKLLNSPKNR